MTAQRLPLSILNWSRSVAGEPDIKLVNRYYEQDPTNQESQVALLTRPALFYYIDLGTSPVRNTYSQPGVFGDALFAVAGNTVYKVTPAGVASTLGTLSTSTGYVSIAITETYAFFADGAGLKCYTENDYARGTLTITGAIAAAETVVIGTKHYKFSGDVSPYADGTASTPWLVLVGGSAADSLQNLFDAIGDTGSAGISYSLALIPNPDVQPSSVTATVLKIRALTPGTAGNSLATTETLANGAWGASTLTGGGGTSFTSVSVPNSRGVISVGVIISFTIVLIAPGNPSENGRFYWIWPGENTIQDLDFATAERSPDKAWNVVVLGDQFWLPGQNTIEVWQPTGDGDAPFERQQGRLFERGAWEGTVVPIGEAMMLVDSTGNVWEVTDAPRIVSTPGITQRIREAINAQRAA